VPAHDERDYAFAKTFGLDIIEVIAGGDVSQAAYTGDGPLVHSDFMNGMRVDEAKAAIIAMLKDKGLGQARVQYRLRDWLFSRQRYWGEPFPIVHHADGEISAVPESELPVVLPEVEDYRPTGSFEPPLGKAKDWSAYGLGKTRELNTMPQWAGSSWYFLRYLDPDNALAPFDREAEKYWMPVDLYIGGAEHAVLHLLYARFWHKFLFDLGLVSQNEPFAKLVNQGLILGEDGEKMSKSRGNVVNPDEVIEQYGADAMRLYEMFMGPLERQKPWQTAGIEGLWRFLNKVWRVSIGDDRMTVELKTGTAPSHLLKSLHKALQKVTEDVESLRFNTAISAMMIYVSDLSEHLEKSGESFRELIEPLVLMTAPFAPHMAEEIWNQIGHTDSVAYATWPVYRPELAVDDEVEVVFQVGGKVRAKEMHPKGLSREQLEQIAIAHPRIQEYLANSEIVKMVVVPDKLVNFVVKPKAG
jgi:leucyl-tRNA synthetase